MLQGTVMAVSTTPSRTIALPVRMPSTLPQILDAFVGGLLELVIHSIEGVRERLSRLSVR